VFIAAAGSNQTPRVRTTATAFSFDAANNVLTVTATTARYADIAERYLADGKYSPGTVVIFGGNAEVTVSNANASTRVAGVITTKPAFLMNNELQGENVVDVALQGRVPVKIIGPVGKGDMMVSTDDGRARADTDPKVGTVIGKALEDFTATPENSETVIEVVIGKT
jgi:hypothetical protein